MKVQVKIGGTLHSVELVREANGWRATVDGQTAPADVVRIAPRTYSVLLGAEAFEIRVTDLPDGALALHTGAREYKAEIVDPRAWSGRRHGTLEAEGRQQVTALMPGKVVRMLVQTGDKVEAGQGLLVVEAMKMQNEVRSPKSGVVREVLVKEGAAVNAGQPLAWIE